MNFWFKNTLMFLTLLTLFACSSIDNKLPITSVNILEQGKTSQKSPKITDVCKGFMLTESQVITFYTVAAEMPSETSSEKFGILPCYTAGTAYLFGKKYQWKIRSGGFGEFFTPEHKILKICGKGCCNKIEGVC